MFNKYVADLEERKELSGPFAPENEQ